MFILPYVYSTRRLPFLTLHTFRILTLGGTELWQEEDTLRLHEDILEPNELPLISHLQHKDIHMCLLDKSRMDLSEYYEWEEIDPSDQSVFCWRTFYLMESTPSSLSSVSPIPSPSSPPSLFLPPPPTARLGPYSCEELLTHLKPDTPIYI